MTPQEHPHVLTPEDVKTASKNVAHILEHAIQYEEPAAAIVVSDARCDLAAGLTMAYRQSLPEATFIDFDCTRPQTIMAAFEILEPGDLVVLIQSTSFRLDSFRIRVELFKRSIKVIEHPHLERMSGEQGPRYLESLAYDPSYFRGVGQALRTRLDGAQAGVLSSGGEELHYKSGFEGAKLNVGDYSQMANVGGQYPIGEVITESKDLEDLHGRVTIAYFAGTGFNLIRPASPITLIIEAGRVTGTENSTPEFDEVLESIKADEGQVWVRELGLGLNRAFGLEKVVDDVGTFERMCGVHLSIGAKHHIFNKPQIKKKLARQHVDVFVATDSFQVDGEELYADGAWLVAH